MLTLLVAAAVAASPMQFDLVCTGTDEEPAIGRAAAPWSMRISVDLGLQIMNFGGAKNNVEITVSPERINFARLSQYDDDEAWIDRVSGELYEREREKTLGVTLVRKAQCFPAQFTDQLAHQKF